MDDYETMVAAGGLKLPEKCQFIRVEFSRSSTKSNWGCRLFVVWCGVNRDFWGNGPTKVFAWDLAVERSMTCYYD